MYLGLHERAIESIAHFDRIVREWNGTPWATTLWFDARTGLPDFTFPGLDWYMNGPSIWHVLSALTGFQPDEPAHRIVLGPYLPPGRAKAVLPVFSPRYWGQVEVSEGAAGRTTAFTPTRFFRGDILVLRQIRWRLANVPQKVTFDGRLIPSQARRGATYTDLCLEEELQVKAGGRLELS
jgi:hypothetical protein